MLPEGINQAKYKPSWRPKLVCTKVCFQIPRHDPYASIDHRRKTLQPPTLASRVSLGNQGA